MCVANIRRLMNLLFMISFDIVMFHWSERSVYQCLFGTAILVVYKGNPWIFSVPTTPSTVCNLTLAPSFNSGTLQQVCIIITSWTKKRAGTYLSKLAHEAWPCWKPPKTLPIWNLNIGIPFNYLTVWLVDIKDKNELQGLPVFLTITIPKVKNLIAQFRFETSSFFYFGR